LRICEIDFPEALLVSQKDSCLAVFAGAGVSMPPPSNYPDFKALANQVAGGVLALGPGEPIDLFLGRLKDRGTNVHRMVGQILTDPESKPNSLHFDLLRLFPSSDAVRLVTTNFDSHFSSAAPLVFTNGKSCEIHYAPAFPLGDSFSGIVYLHGGVERPFERLVLTDSDFGRAYLTEGWARVYLQKLFEKYTVLFVGYSHNDPVMNYLARGLPPAAGTRKRFALTAPGQEEDWKYRGIIPITYRLTKDPQQPLDLPGLPGRQEGNPSYCRCAQRICLTVGVQSVRLCPVLCPPPNPTECYGRSCDAPNSQSALHLVAFGRKSSRSV
jgi:hypothetical protein